MSIPRPPTAIITTSAFGGGINRGIRVVNGNGINTDANDRYDITIIETPH